jgi:hypothetical protein
MVQIRTRHASHSRWLSAVVVAGLAVSMAPAALAQTVKVYTGTLLVGFGDQANIPPLGNDFANNGVPACANLNPFTPATAAVVPVRGYVTEGTGSPASLMFKGYAPLNFTAMTGGGGNPITAGSVPQTVGNFFLPGFDDCIVQFPPWLADNSLRSRVQFGSQLWPGYKLQSLTPSGMAVLTTGPGGGTLAAGGGVTASNPVSYMFQTTQFAPFPTTARTTALGVVKYPVPIATGMGTGFTATGIGTVFDAPSGNLPGEPPVFYGSGAGRQVIIPGPARFGGGVPVNGDGQVQLGVNLGNETTGGGPLSTFGVVDYAEGLLPTGPALYGTSASSTSVVPVGLMAGNPYQWRFHAAGPTGAASTIPLTPNFGWSQGNRLTVGFGVTGTPGGGPNGSATGATGPLLTTPGNFRGIFQKWTTGYVQHSDVSGNYTTIRSAQGFDMAVNPTTQPNGTSRKLQLVTPWSASIQQELTRPWAGAISFLPDFGFGGVSVLTLNVPEPGMVSMLAIGIAGLAAAGTRRQRRR